VRRLLLTIASAAALALLVFVLRSIALDSERDALLDERANRWCPDPEPSAPFAGPAPEALRLGQLLIAHDGTGDASIVDLASGSVYRVKVGLDEPHEAAVSSDGRWGILSDFGDQRGSEFSGNRAAIIDMRERRLKTLVDLGDHRGAHGVAFVTGTSLAAITTQSSQTLVVVDAASGRVVEWHTTGAGGSHLVVISPDGRTAFTVNEGDGSVSRITLGSRGATERLAAAPGTAEGIAVSPDGRSLWVGSRTHGDIRQLDALSGAILATLAEFADPSRLSISDDGRYLVAADPNCGAWVVDLASRTKLGAVPEVQGTVTIAPGGRIAFADARGADAVIAFDLATRTIIATYPLSERPHGVAWGPLPSRRPTEAARQ